MGAWQAGYRGVVPDSYLAGMSVAEQEARFTDVIARGTAELWVAQVRSSIVGSVRFGASLDTDAAPTVGTLEALYVLPAHWSTGIGRALWLMARGRFVEREFKSVTLWVFAENDRAIRFYRAAGFNPDAGAEKETILGGKTLREVRYELPLSD